MPGLGNMQSGGVCDLCAAPLAGDGAVISPQEMRVIANNGYGAHVPFGNPPDRVGALIALAAGNDTPWALCPACHARTRSYLSAPGTGNTLTTRLSAARADKVRFWSVALGGAALVAVLALTDHGGFAVLTGLLGVMTLGALLECLYRAACPVCGGEIAGLSDKDWPRCPACLRYSKVVEGKHNVKHLIAMSEDEAPFSVPFFGIPVDPAAKLRLPQSCCGCGRAATHLESKPLKRQPRNLAPMQLPYCDRCAKGADFSSTKDYPGRKGAPTTLLRVQSHRFYSECMNLNSLWKNATPPAPHREPQKRAETAPAAREIKPAAPAGITKPVFRLDENSHSTLAPGLASEACILFGPHAEDGLQETMEDEEIPSIVIARRATLLGQLPGKIKSCTLMCRYPTENEGGLSASDEGSIRAWSNAIGKDLAARLAGRGVKFPMLISAPDKTREQIVLCFLWLEKDGGVPGRDVMEFAKILEQLLFK